MAWSKNQNLRVDARLRSSTDGERKAEFVTHSLPADGNNPSEWESFFRKDSHPDK
jgi:hypothetical protein